MTQAELALIWKGRCEGGVAWLARATPQVIGRNDKPPVMLPVTSLVGKLWHILPREVFVLFFKLVRVGALTVTMTKESFAVALSLNLTFRFILLGLHVRVKLLHVTQESHLKQTRPDQLLHLRYH